MASGRVGGPVFLRRQLAQGVLNDGTKLAYAFGLEVGEYRGLALVEHSGSTGGYRTDISRFPAQHTSVATMCNFSTADPTRFAHAVADAVLDGQFTKPAPALPTRRAATAQQASAAPALTAGQLDAFTGRFYSDELDATYNIARSGAALVLRRARSAPDTLRAVDRSSFRGGGMTLHFSDGAPSPGFTVDAGRARGIEFARLK